MEMSDWQFWLLITKTRFYFHLSPLPHLKGKGNTAVRTGAFAPVSFEQRVQRIRPEQDFQQSQ